MDAAPGANRMKAKSETLIAARLHDAGINVASFHLRQFAQEALDKHHNNVERAHGTFLHLVDPENELKKVSAMLGWLVTEALIFFLEQQSLLRVGRTRIDTQKHCAGAQQPNGSGDGQENSDARIALTSSEPTSRARNGQEVSETQRSSAAAREPNPPRRLTQMEEAAKLRKVSIFDTFKLSSGHIIFRTPFHMHSRIDNLLARDRAVIKLINSRIANPDPQTTPADYLSVKQGEKIIQKAAEMADVD
jgi:hypothetical protein